MAEPFDPGLPVGEDEADAIRAELARLRDEIPPADRASGGCVVAIVAIISIVLMPFLDRAMDLSSGTLLAIGVALGLVAIVGGAVGIFGGRGQSATALRLDQAIDRIVAEFPDGDGALLLAETIRLLEGAYRSRGLTIVATFDADEVAAWLGGALAYVERIERFLIDGREIDPVFTRVREGDRGVEDSPHSG